jgi:hypothetical protein
MVLWAALGACLPAGSAPAQCATYTVTRESGGTIVHGTTDLGIHCDDCTASDVALPFSFEFYRTHYSRAEISSNGVLRLGTDTEVGYANQCLPQAALGAAILPFWDDLETTDGAHGQGVFTSTTGAAPHRQFHIEYRTGICCGGGPPVTNFEVRLFEGSSDFDIVYMNPSNDPRVGGDSATIGVQDGLGHFMQVSCNQDLGLTSGTILHFQCSATASLPPAVDSPYASPPNSASGGTFSVGCLLNPGAWPPSTGLNAYIDASAVDAGIVPMVDNGGGFCTADVQVGPAAVPGPHSLTITATDDQGRSGSATTSFTVWGPRPNDDCSRAIPAALGDNPFDNTWSAGIWPLESDCYISSPLVYTFSDPDGGQVTVTTCGLTSGHASIAVHEDHCALGRVVACNDDLCGPQGGVSFCAAPNQTYLLDIGSADGVPWSGFFNVSIVRANTPPSIVGSASPPCVVPGFSVDVLARLTAPCPAQGLTSAIVDASSIGGGSVALHDDGASPDAVLSDGIFSGRAVVSGSTPPGAYSLPITATFSGCAVSTSAVVTVTQRYNPPADAIPEGEPCGSAGPYDTFNGGCDRVWGMTAYSHAELCTSYAGTTWNSTGFRDTDWWKFYLPAEDDVTVRGQVAFAAQCFFVLPTCPTTPVPGSPIAHPGGCASPDFSITMHLSAGPAIFFIAPAAYDGTARCDDNGVYWLRITRASNPTCALCDTADFDCDGDVGTDYDIQAFFACLAGNCPAPPCYNSADFNHDGDAGTDADIESFFRVLAGGAC